VFDDTCAVAVAPLHLTAVIVRSLTGNTQEQLGIASITMVTRQPFLTQSVPALSRPRLFGQDSALDELRGHFQALPCQPDLPASSYGGAVNARALFDNLVFGKSNLCAESSLPADPAQLTNGVGDYLSRSPAQLLPLGQTYRERTSRVVFFLRLMRHCRALSADPTAACPYSSAQLDGIAAAVVSAELANLPLWTWVTFPGVAFDLNVVDSLTHWCLVYDGLYGDMTEAQRTQVFDAMTEHADGFISTAQQQQWPTHNGNNWTPVLSSGALVWAVTFWHEDPPRAQQVLSLVLEIQPLHAPMYMPSGVYEEGMSYTDVSFSAIARMQRLSLAVFGVPLPGYYDDRFPALGQWLLDFVHADGAFNDFSDSHRRRGWGAFTPLVARLYSDFLTDTPTLEALAGDDPESATTCFIAMFFANKYYDHGFRHAFLDVFPLLANDWPAIVRVCPNPTQVLSPARVYEDGRVALLRASVPGASALTADSAGPLPAVPPLLQQADSAVLTLCGISNRQPHTELDFGSFIWSAFGDRLLFDLSYGVIPARPRYAAAVDNTPLGHNTLNVPLALYQGVAGSSVAQLEGAEGTVRWLPAGAGQAAGPPQPVIELDGSEVYGASDPHLGWFHRFLRYAGELRGGHFLLADSFVVRASRAPTPVAEFFHTRRASAAQLAALDCSSNARKAEDVVAAVQHARLVTLQPRCSFLVTHTALIVLTTQPTLGQC
jgi:hypothetical protein